MDELENRDIDVSRSAIGMLKARDVHLSRSAAGMVAAKGSVSIQNGGAGPVLANGGVTIRFGGCGPLMANGDVSFEYGGCGPVLAAGGVRIGPQAGAGVVVSPKVTLENGARVLMSTKEAAALGAAAGIAYVMLSRLIRR